MTSLTDPAAPTTFAVTGAVAESLQAARGTEVTFPLGATSGRCRVVATLATMGADFAYVISDRTPFHPCDQGIPKQPGDRGRLEFGEHNIPVLDSYLAEHDLTTNTVTILGISDHATHAGRQVLPQDSCCGLPLTGRDTSLNPSLLNLTVDLDAYNPADSEPAATHNTRLHVAHVISLSDAAELRVGMEGVAHVDSSYRHSLSVLHSAYHLTMLAFNRASRPFVVSDQPNEAADGSTSRLMSPHSALENKSTTSAPQDALGETDVSSLLLHDVSLSPQGFRALLSPTRRSCDKIDVTKLRSELPTVMAEAASTLHQWVESDAMAEIDTTGAFVGNDRMWLCYLPEADVAIPCDGTHAEQLSDLAGVSITFEELPENRWLICGHIANLEA